MAEIKRMLFVDDDAKRMASLVEMLEMEQWEVTHFTSPTDAVEELEQRSADFYSCAVLDMAMPHEAFGEAETDGGRRTGLAVLERLRKHAPELPVIVFSVMRDPDVQARAKELGIQRWISKPALPSELIEAIREVTK